MAKFKRPFLKAKIKVSFFLVHMNFLSKYPQNIYCPPKQKWGKKAALPFYRCSSV